MSKTEIWKVQRSIVTTEDCPQCYIYNKDRSCEGQFPLTPEVEYLFPEGEFKIYIRGALNDEGQVDLKEIVPEEDW